MAAALVLVVAAGCGGGTTQVTGGPDPVRCTTTLTPDSASVAADGGPVRVTISAARECTWTAASDAPWLILGAASGQGETALVVTVASNPHPRPRSAGITVNGQPFTLSQAARACAFELRPASAQFQAQGGTGTIDVQASDGCAWQASTPDTWVRLPNPESRLGPGSQEFEVAANDGPARQAAIRIADLVFTIVQGAPGTPGVPASPVGPPPPADLSHTVVGDSAVDLRWTIADPAAATHVYRDGVLVATRSPGVTTYRDSGLTPATDYTYTVRHARDGVSGPDSNPVTARPVFAATGGTVTISGGYRQHAFTAGGTFVVTQGGTIAEIVIVGGGGGGGGSEAGTDYGGGGGGAGGVRVITAHLESPGSYSIVVGQGGRGGGSSSSDPVNNNGAPGGPSSYGGYGALGGGGGAGAGGNYLGNPGGAGGSGGGGSGAAGGAGTPGEGNGGGAGAVNPGGSAGGGGGGSRMSVGAPGTNLGGAGGAGFPTWAGLVATGGHGGRGPGGTGGSGTAPGEGGDGNESGGNGGRGANGVVLIRYRQ